jgi:hypothetical protein
MPEFTEKYRQLSLFDWQNPFKTKINDGILKGIENCAGIYRFYDKNKHLLYVGKSIQLRTRLLSYGRIQPERDSKRLVRLVSRIDYVETEVCNNEQEALLKENDWLRNYKPEFNRANTRHELYIFVGIKKNETSVHIGWSLTEHSRAFDELFGAFKGLSSTYRVLMSLQRLQALKTGKSILQKKWFVKKPSTKIEWEESLVNLKLDYAFLKEYFMGNYCPIDLWLNDLKLNSVFEDNVFNESLSEYINWFQTQAIRNKALREKFNMKNGIITQEGFDDWIVRK